MKISEYHCDFSFAPRHYSNLHFIGHVSDMPSWIKTSYVFVLVDVCTLRHKGFKIKTPIFSFEK